MPGSLLAVAPVRHPGGAEIVLMRLLTGLRARRWRLLLTTPGPGRLADMAAATGIPWQPLALGGLGRRRGLRAAASWPRARRLSRHYGVVYLNGTVCGRLLPALAGRRTVLHVHDMVDRVPSFWRRADLVLAASQAVADRLEGLHAHVVYPPVDPEPAPVDPPWRGGDGPVVGFVGRIEPRKGVLDLVRAAPAIRRAVPDARIVLVGDDDYGIDADYLAAVRAGPGVEHHGWIDGAPGLMRALDVLVLPSHEEPAGTVLAEAMAVGTPVVATRVDGLPEIVEPGVTGELVEPGAPEELAAAVVRVLEEREAMGAAAARHAERFHVEGFLDEMERLLAS